MSARAMPQTAARPPLYFNLEILASEELAWRLHRHCIRAIVRAEENHQSAGTVQINYAPADIVTLIDNRGRLARYWVRHPMDRRLVVTGTLDGLLPIDSEPIHAT